MALLPKNNTDRVAFFSSRTDLWLQNAVAIGTSTNSVSALTTLVTAASGALDAQTTAHNAAKAATDAVRNAVETMTNAGMAIIEQVRTKARSVGDSVYPLANIPPPATPQPSGEPGEPNRFTAAVNGDGSTTITWKCVSPGGGVTYQVYRRDTPTGEFVFKGNAGVKKFVDLTIPAGSSQVTYQVRGVRSTAAGPWAQFNVNFGAPGVVTSTSEVKLPRMAA